MSFDGWKANWDATPEAAAERESEARDIASEQAEEEQFSPEAQMLDAIGDEVYRLVHESSELRAQLTADQRCTLAFTISAFLNDALLWAEYDAVRREQAREEAEARSDADHLFLDDHWGHP